MPDVQITIRTIAEGDSENRRAIGSLTELNSAISLVRQGLEIAQKAYDATAGKTLEYANQVRSLSMISGESAEETSRFIQVLDDYKIGADDAMAATRALTKNGLEPNIDTLAKLSDEYLSLSSAEEKNAFVLKNLGRAGLQWTEVLNKGSVAIRKQGDAVAQGLLLNQKQLDQARELEIAQDVLSESWEQFALTIGTKAIPATTGIIDEFNNTTRAIEIMKEQGLNPLTEMLVSSDGYIAALQQAATETEANRAAMLTNAEAMDQSTVSLEDQKAALAAVHEANAQFISVLGSVGDAQAAYQQGLAEVDAALAAGDIKVDEHRARVNELASEYARASQQIILSIVEMKLATDGWENAEVSAYLSIAKNLGLMDDAQVAAAKSALATADKLIAMEDPLLHVGTQSGLAADKMGDFGEAADTMGEKAADATGPVSALKSALAKMLPSGTSWDYYFRVHTSGHVPAWASMAGAGAEGAAGGSHTIGTGTQNVGGRDAGGPGFPGKVYMIGKGAQPEMFIPQSAGTFVPNAGGMDTAALVAAIESSKIDVKELAREIVGAMDRTGAY